MSKQVISSSKITKSYQISKSSQDGNGSHKNFKYERQEKIPQKGFTKEIQTKFTGQNASNFRPSQISEHSLRIMTDNIASNRNDLLQNINYNNLDSSIGSLQQRSMNSQDVCTCNKWKTDTHSSYNGTIQTNLTGAGYFTGDDTKEGSMGDKYYKRNTNKTVNRTLNLNDQNIFIQEGNSSDYCNCDERRERQLFSNASSAFNENIQNIATDEDINTNYCTCGQNHRSTLDSSGKNAKIVQTRYSTNMINTSNNEFPLQTTDYEEREIRHRKNIVKKVVNTEINIEVIRKQVREKIRQEIKEEREKNKEQYLWNGENYIQVIERLQYISSPAPPLCVQFLNDMMIKKTENAGPIQVLIPIPDNYIQKQGELAVLGVPKEPEEEKDINEDLCPENVDLLNISHAYSIPVPSFNNLEIENEEMMIERIPKEPPELKVEQQTLYCMGKEKEPFEIENYSWDINPSERMWSGVMRPVRVNKLVIEVPPKPDWNNFIRKESVNKINVKAPPKPKVQKPKEVEQVEEEEEEKEEEPEPEPVEEEIEEIEEEVEEPISEEEIKPKKVEKKPKKEKKEPKKLKKNKFVITYRQNIKRFKKIDLGENEVITLKGEKRILPQEEKKVEKIVKPSENTNLKIGGKGFDADKYKWSPVPFNAQTLTIDRTHKELPLENVAIERMEMPPSKPRRQDWNLVNTLSSESKINLLTKEKVIKEQNIKTITVLGRPSDKNKWNEKSRQNKGPKVSFGPSKKKWALHICKENDILYEQEADDVIINDDYNNVKGPEMRPVTATIIKVKEEDDTSSASSYDVFQNIIIKKTNYEYGYGGSSSLFKKKGGYGYELDFGNGGLGMSSLMKRKKNFEFGIGVGAGAGSGSLSGNNFISQTKIITTGNSQQNYMGSSNGGNFMYRGIGGDRDLKNRISEENYKYVSFTSFGDQGKQSMKLRVSSENAQKNKYDKTVKSLATQTKNLIGNMNMRDMNINMKENMNMRDMNIDMKDNMNMADMNMRGMNMRDMNMKNNMNTGGMYMRDMNMNTGGMYMRDMNMKNNMNTGGMYIRGMNMKDNMNTGGMYIRGMNMKDNMNTRNMNMGGMYVKEMNMNMRDTRNIIGERKKVELIREENEQPNFLKI